MSQILVTGFKPFLQEKVNPSELLCQNSKGTEKLILPVEYQRSFEILSKKLLQSTPEYLIMLGQANGRRNISLEKIGLNWIQTRTPDESGFIPAVGKIDSKFDLAYLSSFPVDQVYEELKPNHPRLEISFSAGTFVCNHIYLQALANFPHVKSVFVHVPLLPQQLKENDDRPSMALDQMSLFLNDLIKILNRI